MRLTWSGLLVLGCLLAGCGGGSDQSLSPSLLRNASASRPDQPQAVRDGPTTAIQLYQAFYGQAPGNALYGVYSTQAASDPQALAAALAANFNTLSDAAMAKLILDNIGITASLVTASGSYQALLGAVQQFFAAYGPASRGQIVLNLTGLLANLSGDPTFALSASAFKIQTALNVTYSASLANAASAPVTSPITAGGVSISGFTLPGGAAVTQVSPATSVNVNGSNFTPGSVLIFNGAVQNSTFLSSTQIQFVVPLGASASGPVVVTSGGRIAVSTQNLSVVNPLDNMARTERQ